MAQWLVAVNRAAGKRSVDPSVISQITDRLNIESEMIVPASRAEMVSAIEQAALDGRTHFAI